MSQENSLSRVCDGRIDVEGRERGDALRVSGLESQPTDWTPFEVQMQWPRVIGAHTIARQVTMSDGVNARHHCLQCDYSQRGSLDPDRLGEQSCR